MRYAPAVGTAIIGLWLGAVGAGLGLLWNYSMASGESAVAPARWPADSSLSRTPGQPTLVMVAHPQCPCSRASVHELSRLMTQARGKMTTHVLFLLPAGYDESWTKSDLWRSAEAIPGVSVQLDPAGSEAGRFGALTSGQALLYGADGRLLFAGGVTTARGHQGDNPGSSAILVALDHPDSPQRQAPVFGCSLKNPETALQIPGDTR